MHKSFVRSLALAAVAALALTFASSAFAQIVTTGMSGTVRAADGKGLAGVTVTAVHTPTNSSYTAVTNAAGRYNFRGLPVGGPYTVSAKTDFGDVSASDVTTDLGSDVEVGLSAKTDVVQLDKFVVGASRSDLDSSSSGAGTTLDSTRLDGKPSSERSFADLVSATPQVTLQALSSANDREEAHITAVGQNNRFNSVMIDGARTNDVFGLNGTGLAAFFNPLSVDNIEQMSIQISPYDASLSGFTGAAINVVTKSGSNKFHGSAYYIFKGDQLLGFNLQGVNPKELATTGVRVLPRLERTTWGATFSGPIWKDHLFFALNYENYESISNGRTLTFTPAAGVEDQILARLKQYSSTVTWGVPVTGATTNRQTETKYLAKLDWKINDKHRLTVRASKTDGLVPQFGNLGSSLTLNGVSGSTVSATPTGHFYDQTRVGKSYSGQLNSEWTADLKTEVRFTRNTDDQLTPTYSTAPLIAINGLSGTDLRSNTAITTGEYIAGTEQFRHGNVINVINRQASAKADYFRGNFVFSAGIEREWSDFYNLFRSGSYGLVAFRNLADFLADTNGVISRNYYDPAVRPVADISDFAVNSIYGQAKWNYSDRLNFIFGLRVEQTDSAIRPALNQAFLTTTGFRNDGSLDGNTTLAPRFGFNYSLDDKRVTQIRGGVGYFNGKTPWVFFSNSFGNTGVGTFSRASTDAVSPLSSSLATYFASEFKDASPIGSGTDNPTLRREVDFNDDKVKMPAVWRGNLAVDRKLSFLDSTVTVEYIHTKVAEGVRTTNENLKPSGLVALDGRTRFSGSPATLGNGLYSAYTNMYRVSNVSVGKSQYFTVSWDRPMKDKWAFNLSYTRGRSTEAQSNSQTTAGGQFFRNVVFNQNAVELGTADYEIKDRIQLSLSRQFSLLKAKGYKSVVSLYYEGRTGNPISWVFGGDLNNDGTTFNDTVVIPTSPTDPKFDFTGMTQAQSDAFFALISSSGLSKYAGQVVPKNSFTEPWVNRLDLNFKQDIPIRGSAKLQLGLDFINFGAFLSKSTFGYFEVAPNQSNDAFRTLTLTSGTSYTATGQIRPLFTGAGPNATFISTPVQIDNLQSRWKIQLKATLMF